jgi:hypothetical protein
VPNLTHFRPHPGRRRPVWHNAAAKSFPHTSPALPSPPLQLRLRGALVCVLAEALVLVGGAALAVQQQQQQLEGHQWPSHDHGAGLRLDHTAGAGCWAGAGSTPQTCDAPFPDAVTGVPAQHLWARGVAGEVLVVAAAGLVLSAAIEAYVCRRPGPAQGLLQDRQQGKHGQHEGCQQGQEERRGEGKNMGLFLASDEGNVGACVAVESSG